MPRILVPVDFSATSLNAAVYAAYLGKTIHASRLTLLSVVSENMVGDDGTPVGGNIDDRDRAVIHKLEELQVSLFDLSGVPTSIELKTGEFSDLMEEYMKQHNFEFVVMGVTGSTTFEQVFGTSRAVEVIAQTNTPVLVVPPMANFKRIKHLAIAVEPDHINDALPYEALNKWLVWFRPFLHIVHVKSDSSSAFSKEEQSKLDLLKERFMLFEPSTHLLHDGSFTDALNQMAESNDIQLLITFPHKHNFFDLLFRTSHTRQLVFQSSIPVLALPYLPNMQ